MSPTVEMVQYLAGLHFNSGPERRWAYAEAAHAGPAEAEPYIAERERIYLACRARGLVDHAAVLTAAGRAALERRALATAFRGFQGQIKAKAAGPTFADLERAFRRFRR